MTISNVDPMQIDHKNRNIGLYIHFPFCQRRCSYCGFLSLENQSDEAMHKYIQYLLAESELQFGELVQAHPKLNGQTNQFSVDTIYIGGGTPSLISSNDIAVLMKGLRKTWPIADTVEITMESNPNSLNEENLRGYHLAGVNRLSIGVQSFDDQLLVGLGRLHDGNCAKNAVQIAKDSGFENINLDLMFGLPGQTFVQWQETLNVALSLAPNHLSLYTLQIEEGTKLYQDYKAGILPTVDLDVDRACYHHAIEILKLNGYVQYEISNFSKYGHTCKHNLKYWSMDEFVGLGLNASSYVDGKRWRNLSEMDQWAEQIKKNQSPIDFKSQHIESLKDAMGTFLFTGLRKTEGISFKEFKTRYDLDFFQVYEDRLEQLEQYRKQGLLDWSDPEMGRLWITELGIDCSNDIMSEFV
jgi:oxygen-independent coproporphyrinogen III oxidase